MHHATNDKLEKNDHTLYERINILRREYGNVIYFK
jgi:hypothetical protein